MTLIFKCKIEKSSPNGYEKKKSADYLILRVIITTNCYQRTSTETNLNRNIVGALPPRKRFTSPFNNLRPIKHDGSFYNCTSSADIAIKCNLCSQVNLVTFLICVIVTAYLLCYLVILNLIYLPKYL